MAKIKVHRLRSVFALLVLLAAGALPLGAAADAVADAPTEIRIATLAPNGSSWMKVFNAWNRSVRKQTNDTLKLRFYPGGSQGDERDFIRKMRAGQVDGASITTLGLSKLVRSVLVLTVPGVFNEYEQLDRVRDALGVQLEELFDKEGYVVLAWGDVGKTRLFSTERIERPSEIKKRRPWAWKDDVLFTELLKVIGANPVRLGMPEVYPGLQTRMIDTVPASALAALSMQWYTRLKYVSKSNSGIIVGATVIRKDRLEALSEEHRRVLLDTSAQVEKALQKAIRRDDGNAYQAMIGRTLVAVDTTEYQGEWEDVSRQVRERLAGRVYPKSLLEAVTKAAAE
jgi:TRAP-type C4-dicarboxylate transport system substrate-binding protein